MWSWLLPASIVLVFQVHGVTINGNSLGSTVPVSDPAGWLECSFSFPVGDQWTSGWCLRRPLAFIVLAPLHQLTIFGTAVTIILQTAIASFSLSFLSREIFRTYGHIWSPLLVLVCGYPMIIEYGVYLGPELLSLALSALAFGCYLAAWRSGNSHLFVPAVLFSSTAYLMRPGNPIVLVGLLILAAVGLFILGSTLVTKLSSVAASLLPFAVAPAMRLSGISEAGHSANSAASLYSLVSSKAEGWPHVYTAFPPTSAEGTAESFAWKDRVLGYAAREFMAEPSVAFGQFGENVALLLDRGFLNQMLKLRGPDFDGLANFSLARFSAGPFRTTETFVSVGLWALSLGVLVSLIVGLAKQVGKIRAFTDSPNLDGAARYLAEERDYWLSLALVIGIFGVFGVFGHDESHRHMLINIPFLGLLLPMGARVFIPKRATGRGRLC